MSDVRLNICMVCDGNEAALRQSLEAVKNWRERSGISGGLRVLRLDAEETALADAEVRAGSWTGSVSELWRQALAEQSEQHAESGNWLLLEAGETPETASLSKLVGLTAPALVAIRRGDQIEHAPRLLTAAAAANLQGRVYPTLGQGVVNSGISIDAGPGLAYHAPEARLAWLTDLNAAGCEDGDLLYELGNLHFRAQRDQAALGCFERLVKGDEQAFWTLAGRVMELKTRWELQQRDQVISMLESYRSQNPAIEWVPGLWVLRGVIARQLREPDLAMECFQQVRELAARPEFAAMNPVVALPDISWKPQLGLAEIQLSEGLFSQAWINFSKVRDALKDNDYVATELLKASFFIHRYDSIREILAQGLPLRGLSQVSRRMVEALLALQTSPNLPADYGFEDQDAELMQSDPFMVSVMLELSIAMLRKGHGAQAKTLLSELALRMPQQPVIWHNLAFVYFSEGDFAQAEHYYRQALTCDPHFHESRFDLAKVLVQQQKRDQALQELYQLQLAQPHDPRVRQAIRQLEPEEIDAFVPPARQTSPQQEQSPYIFVFPLPASWENGADIALKAFYQEFVGEDQVVLAFPQAEDNEILASARAWAEARYAAELLPPVALLQAPLPLLPGQSAWVLPWRVKPEPELLSKLEQSGYPAIHTAMRLRQPKDQPLPAASSAETSGERRRIWVEADVDAIANQMRLALQGDLEPPGTPDEILTHAFVSSGSASAAAIDFQPPAEQEAPGISVCMIVKDEAEMLPKCLESVVGQVAEIIVVDTGSSDNTRELAAAYPGVKLFDFSWRGDFAAARNFAVAQASQPWILMLDADEFVGPDFIPSLKRYLSQPRQPDAYAFPVLALGPDGEPDPLHSLAAVPRLFPNAPEYSFRGRIHEMIYHRDRKRMRYFHMQQLPIWHRGYQAAVVEAKQKNLRDTALIEQMMREQPDAVETHRLYLVLAGLYQAGGEIDKALATIEQGLSQVKDDDQLRGMLLRRKLQLLLSQGRDSDVLELAGLASGDPFMAASRAQALARLSRPGEALQAAREALQLAEAQALEPDPLEIQLNRSDLLWDLAQLAERNGELQLALYYLKRHLKLTPSTESWKHYEALQLRLREREAR